MNKIFLLLCPLLMFVTGAAHAATVTLSDPSLMECVLVKDPGFYECDINYDGVLIYSGPMRTPAEAGADCLACRNIKDRAQSSGLAILLDRQASWDDDWFLTLIDAAIAQPPIATPMAASSGL